MMHQPYKGGTSVILQQDDYTEEKDKRDTEVYLPPVGYVYQRHPRFPNHGELVYGGVFQRSDIEEEQYWDRGAFLAQWDFDYRERRKKEKRHILDDPEYLDHELEDFREAMWKYRFNGMWFMNNGTPIYITGLYWFYLVTWKLDVGFPKFKLSDWEWFTFWQYCCDDPLCMGDIEVTRRRQGKCFAKNTPIRMFDGTIKKVQDVRDGELVMGDDGTSRLVYGSTSGVEQMYKVIPNKGESFECNESHILHTKKMVTLGPRNNKHREWPDYNVSVKDYLTLQPTVKRRLQVRREGFELPETSHIVDPYFLGLWLGDGHKRDIVVTNIDSEVINYLKEYSRKMGVEYHNYGIHHSLSKKTELKIKGIYDGKHHEFNSKRDFMRHFGHHPKSPFYSDKGKRQLNVWRDGEWEVVKESNPIRDEFNRLGVINNKHIPVEYLQDSLENRLKLLAGLIDSDGTLIKNKNYRIVQSLEREKLGIQIVDLARSCGLAVNHKVEKRKKKNWSDIRIISIYGEIWKIPTKIKRKQSVKVNRKYNSLWSGFKVEKTKVDKYYGFAVDGNHLFLLGDGTVVHNTMRSGCMLYEYASCHREAYVGIQSKSGSDAKENVYSKGVLNKLKYLWDFFIPKYDLEKGKYPKSGLFFTETNVRGKGSLEDLQSSEFGELMSALTWKPSDHVSYDGEKLHRYVSDECGKTVKPINIYIRHGVVYFCFLDDELQVIGKSHNTTTVEDITAGGAELRLLWDASNQSNKDENGMTNSGLYRFFMPAHKSLSVDKYGMPDEDKALRKIMARRKKLKEDGDYVGLAAYIRKNPITVSDIFYIDPNDCAFDTIRLNERLEQITWMSNKDLYHIGNLSWVDGPDSEVKFTPHPQGKWWVRKDYDPNDPSLWNFTTKEGGIKKPNGNRMAGIDPFSHDKTKDKRNSDGACYVGTLPNATDNSTSNVPIVEYIARPKTASLFYEDMTMTLFWTGAEATIEDNKIGLINHLKERDYVGFIKEFDGKPGISGSTSTHPHVMAELEEFVSGKENDLFKCTFVRLLSDLFSFDITDTEKNDASMAFAYYRIGCFAYKYKKKPSKSLSLSNNLVDVSEIFPN